MKTLRAMRLFDFFGWCVYETLPVEKRDQFLCDFARKTKPAWWVML